MKPLCPCLSQKDFSECCEPYINNECLPKTPEKLMRSRYTAYASGNVNYLLATHHPSRQSINEKNELLASIQGAQWLGLIVHDIPKPLTDTGEVVFSAYYKNSESNRELDSNASKRENLIQQIHERSRFIKENQQWFYLSGEFLPDHHLSRNDQCFCGSLKKYKRCHGR